MTRNRMPLSTLQRPTLNQTGPRHRRLCGFLWSIIIGLAMSSFAQQAIGKQTNDSLREERQQFQVQELIPSRFGGWVFQVGNSPRLIWRDVDEVRRLGRDVTFRVRWFDADLNESEEPDKPGRWMAWVEGQAPNGTPFRRSFTFFAFPQKIENSFVPDLSVAFLNFPGKEAPPAWLEHKSEFDRSAKDFLTRGLIDSEQGAILIAGIAESKLLGRPKRFVESTSVVNSEYQLALKRKILGLSDVASGLQPARVRTPPSPVLHHGPAEAAGVPASAKAVIDQFCCEWATATGEPFVTLVARNGVIVTHEAFGKSPDNGAPIDKNYRCWIASLTKTVTALMFSQFVDQRLIELDAPISKVFPGYPLNDPNVPTFRQCLNHTGGFSGLGDFGGMKNPHLENIILNGIDANEPGKAYSYTGVGFELVAKAMECVSGKCAVRLYHEHLFEPLGFGDVVLGNASSDGEFTAMELGILAQWIANRGSYGGREFISAETFEKLLPKPLTVPGEERDVGLGMHWVRHLKPDAPADSDNPEDLLFSTQTVGHGSFSGCILVVDLQEQLVIVQVRRKFGKTDSAWWTRFFQTIAAATSETKVLSRPDVEKSK